MTADSSWQPDAGPGLWLTDTEPASVDTQQLRAGRLARLRDMMREKDYAGLLLFDPFNQRYATGSRNMFGYFLRNSTRYFFVPTEGPIILFEYPQSAHVSTGLETVDEARHSGMWEITHQYELDHTGHLSSGIRAGDQTTRRALCPMRKPRSAPTPRTTAASPPVNTDRVARDAPHDNILTTRLLLGAPRLLDHCRSPHAQSGGGSWLSGFIVGLAAGCT